MAFVSDRRFLVLHGLRLKGFCDCTPLAESTGVDPADAEKILDELKADGLVIHREGRLSGWALTPAGRSEHGHLIAEETTQDGVRAGVEQAYRRFLEVNADLLAVCTDWQIRTDKGDQVVNDHTDAAYDRDVIARLRKVNDGVQPICAELTQLGTRFGAYGPRLDAALTKVEAGETEWFTKPLIDSYHTVWFELHEDLLVTLAIERSKEGQS